MKPERWQKVDELLSAALEREAGQRVSFLARACEGDEELRKEVEELLSAHEAASNFLNEPPTNVGKALAAAEQALGSTEQGANGPTSTETASSQTELGLGRRSVVAELFEPAVEREPVARADFLAKAAAGDAALAEEVLNPSLATDLRTLLEEHRTLADEGEQTVPTQGGMDAARRGSTLGRYIVLNKLGGGGMGVVYAAYDPELDRKVAVKLLRAETASHRKDSNARERLLREAQAMARLSHPNVIPVYDVGTLGEQVFIAMELIDGRTLKDWLKEKQRGAREVLDVFIQAGKGLAAAHAAGLVHRDFKPDNVLIGCDGQVKVLDFGIARAVEDLASGAPTLPQKLEAQGPSTPRVLEVQLTKTGMFLGTPAYMAPEQLLGKATDARTDQFSFCVALYEALYGERPFDGSGVDALTHQVTKGEVKEPSKSSRVPSWVRQVLLRGLRPNPKERFPSMDALLRELGQSPPVARRRVVLVALTLAFAVLALAAVAVARLQKADYFWRNPLANARYQNLTEFEGTEHSAAISRDGKFVAFLSSRDGPVGVFVTQIGTGTFRNVTWGRVPEQLILREIRTMEFSPDGARVFFWVGASDTLNRAISTWVVPTLGGEPHLALEGVAEIGWSPDGRRLVYHTPAPGDPMFVKAEGAEAQPLHAAPVPQHAHFQTWSPDESFIYFVQGYSPNEMDIWRIRPTGGTPERITFHNSRVSHPTFLDRSTLLYLAADADGSGPWIYGLDVERRVPHRLSSGVQRWTSLEASGDGRRLVATATQIRPSLWRVPLSARPAEMTDAQRIPLPTAEGRSPMLAADYLLYVSSDGMTERIWKLVGENATELWTAPGARIIGGPAIAPEGDRIAFSIEERGKTRLVVMNSDGTSVRIVVDSMELRGAPVWSPDGQSVVTAANQRGSPRLFRISPNTREAVQMSDDYALDPAWAPRGEFLVYSGMNTGTTFPLKAITPVGQLYKIPELRLSRSSALGVTQVDRRLRFLPGQGALVVLRGDLQHKNLWAWELTIGSWRQLTNFGRDIVIGDFDVSPDGSLVVFERVQEHSDIVVIDRTQ
jgi:Tol biopolymer transport system component/tRNA A-37 threonylcarbamoyl transferase component Bud32